MATTSELRDQAGQYREQADSLRQRAVGEEDPEIAATLQATAAEFLQRAAALERRADELGEEESKPATDTGKPKGRKPSQRRRQRSPQPAADSAPTEEAGPGVDRNILAVIGGVFTAALAFGATVWALGRRKNRGR